MTRETVALTAVSVVHVPKDEEISHICTLENSDIKKEENKDIRALAEGVVSDILQDKRYGNPRSSPKYGESKSARVQNIRGDLDQDKEKVIECIKRVRTTEEMTADSKALARLYKKQRQSREDALVIASYQYNGIECAAVLKIPYKEEVYQTGEDDVKAAERIIEKDVDKSLIYPSVEPSTNEEDKGAMKSYQANTSSPAQYWQDFAGLKQSLTPDEILFEKVSRGEVPFVECETIKQLQNRREELDTEELDGSVKIKIGEIEFRTELRNILDPEKFEVKKDGENTSFLLKGSHARISVKEGRNEHSIAGDEI